jgi:sulfite reductase alpha subunit-like flavoprotein
MKERRSSHSQHQSHIEMPFLNSVISQDPSSKSMILIALRKKMLEDLSAFIKDQEKKEELLSFGKKEKAEDFSKIVQNNWTIIDIIEKYNVEIPMEAFFTIVPRNLERYYTIASSALLHPD